MVSEKLRQTAKERAVLIALCNGMAFIRREIKIYGLRIDGSVGFISSSTDYDYLWQDAFSALENKFGED